MTETGYQRLTTGDVAEITRRHVCYTETHQAMWADTIKPVGLFDVLTQADDPDDDGFWPTLQYPDPATIRDQVALIDRDSNDSSVIEAWIRATLALLRFIADLDGTNPKAVTVHISKSVAAWAALSNNNHDVDGDVT